MICRICGSDNAKILEDSIDVNGKSVIILYTECEDCSREFVPADQIIENDRRIKEINNERVSK